MTNYILKVKTDTDGVIDTHIVYTSSNSVAEAESKVLAGLKFPSVSKKVVDEDGTESTETVAVKLSVISIEEFPANTHLV